MTALTFTVMLALVATIVVFGVGIGSMVHGGKFDIKHCDQFMSARVGIQAVAILLLLFAIFWTAF